MCCDKKISVCLGELREIGIDLIALHQMCRYLPESQ